VVGSHHLRLGASLPSLNISSLLLFFLLLIHYHWLGRVGGFGLGCWDRGVLFLLPLFFHLLLLQGLLLFVVHFLPLLEILQFIFKLLLVKLGIFPALTRTFMGSHVLVKDVLLADWTELGLVAAHV